jgi:mannose-6-phosphate isomerase-like protein (cupin superfamily)
MTATAKHFTNVDIGSFSRFGDESQTERTKSFFKEKLGLSGMEISVTAMPKGTQSPFFHSHKQNEELYIVVAGSGQMQLDDDLIDVKEGSMINVLPQCRRGLRANQDAQLVYLCIQAKTNSLEQHTKEDGVKHEDMAWLTKLR